MRRNKKSLMARLIDGFSAFFAPEKILAFIEKKVVKAAIKKLLGTVVMGGIRGWIIKFVIGEIMDFSDDKIVEPIFRKLGYVKDVKEGGQKDEATTEAKTDDDWRDSIVDS